MYIQMCMRYYNPTEANNPRPEIMTTQITYSNNNNPMDLVLIKEDDSFVIIGDHDPSDETLIKMVDYQDIEGYTMH